MARTLAALFPLLLGAGLLLVGNGLLGTLLPLRLTLEGATHLRTGVVMAAYFAGFAAGTLTVDRAIASVGPIRAFTAFAAGLACVALGHVLSAGAWPWIVLRAAAGFFMAGLYVTVESWLNVVAASARRGQILSAYMTTVFLGLGLGQLLLNLWPVEGAELLCVVALAVSLGVIPVALSPTPAPHIGERAELPVRLLLAEAPLGMAGAVTSGLVTSSIFAVAPTYALLSGIPREGIAFFMTALILSGLLLQWPLGRISDWTDRRRVLVGAALALSAVCAFLALAAPHGALLYAGAVLFGGLAFTFYPLALSHALDYTGSERAVGVSSLLLLLSGLGSIAGPILTSLAMTELGPSGLFTCNAALGLVLAVYGLWRIRVRRAAPERDREPYVALPRTTATVATLDPRAEEDDFDLEVEEEAP